MRLRNTNLMLFLFIILLLFQYCSKEDDKEIDNIIESTEIIKEGTTNDNGIIIFKDRDTGEEVKIDVKDNNGNPINDIKVGYIDLDGCELFQLESQNDEYLPLLKMYSHNSLHSITMSLPDMGPIVERYDSEEDELAKTIKEFAQWTPNQAEAVYLGEYTLQEWIDLGFQKMSICGIFFPSIGQIGAIFSKINDGQNLLIQLFPELKENPYTNPDQKFHVYRGLFFDGITTGIHLLVPIEDGVIFDYRDGIIYKTIKIGNQWWMAENLKYYTDYGSWIYGENDLGIDIYGNIQNNLDKHGRLYDWYAASSYCPSGWHLPTDEEWKVLEQFIGIPSSEIDLEGLRGTNHGDMLKLPEYCYANQSCGRLGFNATLGGWRLTEATYLDIDYQGHYWSSTTATKYGSEYAWKRTIGIWHSQISRDILFGEKVNALSVRCIQN